MTAASTPREAIAELLWRKASGEYDYDRDDPAWNDTADAILSALAEAGWTIAKLELEGVKIGNEVFDDEPDARYGDAPRLYRILPQEES